MSDPFLSSDEYDERAHQFYNEGQYDDAIDTLREGLGLYPHAVELHVGMGYARLAREEYAWARRSFEEARGLDPDHEDTLAGLGEVLLKFGERAAALACFERVLALGFQDDHDLMLQIGRALFREAVLDQARRFFEGALNAHPDSADAAACVGHAAHRAAGDEKQGRQWRQRRQRGSAPCEYGFGIDVRRNLGRNRAADEGRRRRMGRGLAGTVHGGERQTVAEADGPHDSGDGP